MRLARSAVAPVRRERIYARFCLHKGGYGPHMGLFDLVKELLGDADNATGQPSLAQITIISTEPVKATSESQSSSAQG